MSREHKESRESASHEPCDCPEPCKNCRCKEEAKEAAKRQFAQVPALTGMVWLPSLGALMQ